MPKKAQFLVRAVISDAALRDRFDRWYAHDHLPRALREFKAERAWRCWSTLEPGVHYAFYEFADMARLDAALKSDAFKALVADFDRNFPGGVTRSRDILSMAEELEAVMPANGSGLRPAR